jgi:hypothetical protein
VPVPSQPTSHVTPDAVSVACAVATAWSSLSITSMNVTGADLNSSRSFTRFGRNAFEVARAGSDTWSTTTRPFMSASFGAVPFHHCAAVISAAGSSSRSTMSALAPAAHRHARTRAGVRSARVTRAGSRRVTRASNCYSNERAACVAAPRVT